jgi:hypothetical protein
MKPTLDQTAKPHSLPKGGVEQASKPIPAPAKAGVKSVSGS